MSRLAISTRWNAGHHQDGRALIEECLTLGLDRVELGYDLRAELIEGVKAMIASGSVQVNSVHNFCPVPVGAPRPHPELYTPASPDRREREYAVTHISKTLRFAAEVGARVAVLHSGNVDMNHFSLDLMRQAAHGQQFSQAYENMKLKCQIVRDKRAVKQIPYLQDSLEQLLPVIEETGVVLALENLPTWEAIPTELESEKLMKQFHHRGIRLWWDIGHGQIRDNLGFINSHRWLHRLLPWIEGFHVHDVAPPGQDHIMPPKGEVDFKALSDLPKTDKLLVLEPAPGTATQDILDGIEHLNTLWNLSEPKEPLGEST